MIRFMLTPEKKVDLIAPLRALTTGGYSFSETFSIIDHLIPGCEGSSVTCASRKEAIGVHFNACHARLPRLRAFLPFYRSLLNFWASFLVS